MHCAGSVSAGFVSGLPSSIQTNRVHRRIDDAEFVVFRKECVLEGDSRLYVVDSLYVRDACASPGIRQCAILANGRQSADQVTASAKGFALG